MSLAIHLACHAMGTIEILNDSCNEEFTNVKVLSLW
jgi:hypothetical protein